MEKLLFHKIFNVHNIICDAAGKKDKCFTDLSFLFNILRPHIKISASPNNVCREPDPGVYFSALFFYFYFVFLFQESKSEVSAQRRNALRRIRTTFIISEFLVFVY